MLDDPDRLIRAAPLGVAVSGGSDSTALLVLLHDLLGPGSIRVATVDHGLRAGSRDEAAAVARFCADLGIGHDLLTWDGWDGRGNLQGRARRARYDLLGVWAQEAGLGAVCLGHTRDDAAETLLMELGRGAGIDGLARMRADVARGGMRFLRPLLRVGRERLRDMLTARGIGWAEDPSNADPRFDRVRARAALASMGIETEMFVRSAENLTAVREALDHTADAWSRENVKIDGGDLIFPRAPFAELPRELARRLLVAGLRWIAPAGYPPRAAPVLALIGARPTLPATTLHGCILRPEGRSFRLSREPNAARTALPARPGAVWDGRWRLDGPVAGARVSALGEAGLRLCPRWRETGRPRVSLLASPAAWSGDILLAAPLARPDPDWTARLAGGRDVFAPSHLPD